MQTILERGIKFGQKVFLDTELCTFGEGEPEKIKADILGADFENGTITLKITVPDEWVVEAVI